MNENNMPEPGQNSSKEVGSQSSSESLNVPAHVPEKVQVVNPAHNESKIKVSVPASGIKVVALRKGFFGQQRLREGDKFVVSSLQELGEWMKCEDSNLEKQRVEFFKQKKAKQMKLKEEKEKARK